MRLHSDRVVSAEVLRGLEKNSQRSAAMIGRTFPAFLRRFGRAGFGVPGSLFYRDLQHGRISYRMYCFAKD